MTTTTRRTTVILDDDTRAMAVAIAERHSLTTLSDGIRLAVADVYRRMVAEADAGNLAARVARLENIAGIGE